MRDRRGQQAEGKGERGGAGGAWPAAWRGGALARGFLEVREFSVRFPTARMWGREAAESPSGNFGRMFQMFWRGEQRPWDVVRAGCQAGVELGITCGIQAQGGAGL